MGGTDCPHHHIRVAIEVLGARVDYNVRPQGEGPLEIWGEEGVVNHNQNIWGKHMLTDKSNDKRLQGGVFY